MPKETLSAFISLMRVLCDFEAHLYNLRSQLKSVKIQGEDLFTRVFGDKVS